MRSLRLAAAAILAAAVVAVLGGAALAASAAGLVTTEKDWVRLRRLPLSKGPVYVVSVRLELSAGHAAWRAAFEKACPRR